jgi:hypothetical protein
LSYRDSFNLESDVLEARIQVAYDELVKSPPPFDGRMRWVAADFRSLDAAIDLDQFVVDEGIGYAPSPQRELREHLTDWRKALPFSEGERTRIVEVRREYPYPARLASAVRREVDFESVMDAGIETPISGKHLMQTWWRWRRGFGERFEGQQGVERATRSLWLARRAIIEGTMR